MTLFPKGFWQFYPYLRILVFFLAGILVGYYVPLPSAWIPFSLAAVSLMVAIVFLRRRYVSSVSILCSVLFSAVVLMMSYTQRLRSRADNIIAHERDYRAVVVSQPERRGKTMSMDLYLPDYDCKVKAHILRDGEGRATHLIIGQGVVFHSIPERPRNWKSDGKFNYERWLNTHHFLATVFLLPQDWHTEVLDVSKVSHFERAQWRLLSLRSQLVEKLGITSTDASSALLLALTLGDKRLLSTDLRNAFSDAGIAHLLALSGLHLSMLYGFILLLLSGFRQRWLATLGSIVSVWIYVMLVGLPVSAVRAAIMLTVYGITAMGYRGRVALNVLSLTALVMMAANPLLLWDVSFELSFLAMLSIGVYFPSLYKIGRGWKGILRRMWGLVAVSVAAQIGTVPLVLYYFGRVNLYSPLTSLFFIPLTMLILYLGFSGILVYALGWNGSLLVAWAMRAAGWLSVGASQVNTWPGGLLRVENWSLVQTLLLYVLIAVLSLMLFKAAKIAYSGRTVIHE